MTGERLDLRSDLLSPPTEAMLMAVAREMASPGAFGLRDDASQRRLEAKAAELFGMEDALLMPTCTMANQVAIHLLCRPGETVLTDDGAHVATSEAGAPAALSGAMIRTLPATNGAIDLLMLEKALAASPDAQRARVALVVEENTHNRSGGAVLSPEYHAAVCRLAAQNGARVHIDGARIFNAATALNVPVTALTKGATSVAISLNKGLCAPMGAILAGSQAFIAEALSVRQMFGGGLRPSGWMAAAGLIALEDMVGRLAEDHAVAGVIADGLSSLDAFSVEPNERRTNIVVVAVETSDLTTSEAVAELARRNIFAIEFGERRIRLCVHRGIGMELVPTIVGAFAALEGESGEIPQAKRAGGRS